MNRRWRQTMDAARVFLFTLSLLSGRACREPGARRGRNPRRRRLCGAGIESVAPGRAASDPGVKSIADSSRFLFGAV